MSHLAVVHFLTLADFLQELRYETRVRVQFYTTRTVRAVGEMNVPAVILMVRVDVRALQDDLIFCYCPYLKEVAYLMAMTEPQYRQSNQNAALGKAMENRLCVLLTDLNYRVGSGLIDIGDASPVVGEPPDWNAYVLGTAS